MLLNQLISVIAKKKHLNQRAYKVHDKFYQLLLGNSSLTFIRFQ